MKNLIIISFLLVSSVACQLHAEPLNYDPKYVWTEYLKCNGKPLVNIMAACEKEQKKGLEHQPACKTQMRFEGIQTENDAALYFGSGKKYTCEKMKY